MARPLRIEFEGALYHVMSRGNDRRAVVRDDADRGRRLEWLARTVETYGWRLHAFCLMDNHEHLFVETPEANLSAGMQHLNGSYTSYFNRRHRRVGHLFQGRFKAQIVDNEGYYWEISRYIHLNPVRARRVERPEEWRWSSYAGYDRASRQLPWVEYHRVLREFGRQEEQARRAYRRFVLAGVDDAPACPWAGAVQGLIVGREAFIEKVRRLVGRQSKDRDLPAAKRLRRRPGLSRVVQAVAEAFGADRSTWSAGRRSDDVARAAAAWLARRRFGYRAREVADALGYTSHGGVVAAIQRVEAAWPRLERTLKAVERGITVD
ncbi:MAG: transposase [Planctomycetes bacterium]|nr:transposase [Planctomycetota bacterium]